MVLQGFRGELTLLDRAGGGSGVGDLASDGAGGEVGSSAATPQATTAGVRRSSAEMDDEIPF